MQDGKATEGMVWDWQVEGPNTKSLHQRLYLDLQILLTPHPHWRRNTGLSIFQRQVSITLPSSALKDWDTEGKEIPTQTGIRKI
jgi:hypothetical protein